jgi:hypothetical protein
MPFLFSREKNQETRKKVFEDVELCLFLQNKSAIRNTWIRTPAIQVNQDPLSWINFITLGQLVRKL